MNKFVVYTVIVGDYDEVKQPAVIDPRFDFVLFSDTHVADIGVWERRPIPYSTDKQWLLARYPRLCPEVVLQEYEAWLYLDGTIQITSQSVYDRFFELFNQGVEWAGMKHQARDCAYYEINAILSLAWVHDYEVLDWHKYLRDHLFPEHFGLLETGVIYRKNTPNVEKINKLWWESLENYNVRRDQFSLMYSIWKTPDVKMEFFLPAGETVWNNKGCFQYTQHKPHNRVLHRSVWEKCRDRCIRVCYAREDNDFSRIYIDFFDTIIKYRHPHLAMFLWTIYGAFRYGYKVVIEMIRFRLKKSKSEK